jgi:hypothetical protein
VQGGAALTVAREYFPLPRSRPRGEWGASTSLLSPWKRTALVQPGARAARE